MSLEDVESTEAAILDAIGEAILVVESDGSVVYQSPSVGETFGYAEEQLVGTDVANRVEFWIADAHGWSVAIEEGTDGGARFAFRSE